MTVESTTNRAQYGTNGTTGPWTVPWQFYQKSDVLVIHTDADGVETELADADYSVTGTGDEAGGTVTTTTAYASGGYITLLMNFQALQETDYTETDAFPAETHERALDLLTRLVQQNQEITARALVFSPSDTSVSQLPLVSQRAGKLLSFDSLGAVTATIPSEQTAASVMLALAAADGASLVGVTQAGEEATLETVETLLNDFVSVRQFGAVCDGTTNDSAAVQAAIDYCAANNWPALKIPGRCRLGSAIKIDREVGTTTHPFVIYGEGPKAGFYTTTNVNMFDTDLPVTTDPQSENIVLLNLLFETLTSSANSFVLTGGKFLRMAFLGCDFSKIRCLSSTIYTQSYYFWRCRVRDTLERFYESAGWYDIHVDRMDGKFCVTGFRSLDTVRGITEASFTRSVWEGNTGSFVEATGANGLTVAKNYIEFNAVSGVNLALGVMTNQAVTIQGNIFVQGATQLADAAYYDIDWGLTSNGVSLGNYCNGKLHKGVSATNVVSIGDTYTGSINAAAVSTMGAVTRFGGAQTAWTDSASHLVKTTAGEFGMGAAAVTGVRHYIRASSQGATEYAAVLADSLGNDIIQFRADRKVVIPTMGNYANDAAAAAGGVPVGGIYRNGSVLQYRVT